MFQIFTPLIISGHRQFHQSRTQTQIIHWYKRLILTLRLFTIGLVRTLVCPTDH